MALYNIRKVRGDEVGKLQEFLDVHWKKGHSLVKSRALLDWQHYDKVNDEYNYFVAVNTETGEFDAIIGFIPLAQYDPALAREGNYWGAIWKIREDVDNNEIHTAGFMLLRKLFKLPNFQSYSAVGISDIAKQIYKVMRLPVFSLSQYYILNEEVSAFHIAKIVDRIMPNVIEDKACTLKWKDTVDWSVVDVQPYYKPLKSASYFKKRYSEHPIYKYNFIEMKQNGVVVAILACRKITIGVSSVIRIVDVLGKLSGSYYKEFQRILKEQDSEYVDFYNYGIDECVFTTLGFVKNDFDGVNIIPNYFEPFEPCNVKIEVGYKSSYPDYVAFKGDSDQDRPNIL